MIVILIGIIEGKIMKMLSLVFLKMLNIN